MTIIFGRYNVKAFYVDQFHERCNSVVNEMYTVLTIGRSIENNVLTIEHAVDDVVKLCRQRIPGEICLVVRLILTVLKYLDDDRFSPTLLDTFNVFYACLVTKKKGRRLEDARRKLIWKETANETKAFGSRRLEVLARYLDENPTVVYHLHRLYVDKPHFH